MYTRISVVGMAVILYMEMFIGSIGKSLGEYNDVIAHYLKKIYKLVFFSLL